ncbi:MAG: DUF4959 domain-containing protein [Bacteroidales bacterium]|jgi:hypothetical protein|nr:DUF4959 domain-containing protein [Bacteroidales bacterium]
MKNRIIYIIISLMLVLYAGCKEEDRIDHIDDSAPAPAQVTDVTVRNTAGGAVLKYLVSDDKNLLYVQAVYEIQPGIQREAKSSFYKDSLVLEGFGDTRTYDVQLYSVGKNEKKSEPLTVQVNPTTAPVRLATKSLKETFGGVSVNIENPGKTNLAIVLMADTANVGYLSILHTFYTSMPKASFSFRGLDSVSYDFAVYLRDRWNNLSDTITNTLKPIYEEEITKGTWKEYALPGDTPPLNENYRLQNIWNNNLSNGNSCLVIQNQPLPAVITWDFGKTVTLSRLKLWPREHVDDRWRRGQPRIFEIYGSTTPNPNGDLDESWIPLGRFECIKPTPDEAITQEDIDFARAGIDFDFAYTDFAPDPFVPIRYIRIKTISTFNNTSISNISIQEVSFWGTVTK